MRVVIDTVVFVRALINRRSHAARLVLEMGDRYDLLASSAIVSEVRDVLYRPALRRRFPQMTLPRLEAMMALVEAAEMIEPVEHQRVCRDPHDDRFFDCAREGAADYIVSEDRDILAVGEHRGTRAIAVREFLTLLGGADE